MQPAPKTSKAFVPFHVPVPQTAETSALLNVNAVIGFLAPQPFDNSLAVTIDANYGTEYQNARLQLNNVLRIYAARFGGLRRMNREIEAYEREIDVVHAAASSFVDVVREMFDRVVCTRDDTPAVEFCWTFVEPAVLFSEHDDQVSDQDTDEDSATVTSASVHTARNAQADYSPPRLAWYASPSLLVELASALTLLVAVQLRALASERRQCNGLHPESVEPIVNTLKELRRIVRSYIVPPRAESRSGATHPFVVSEHFVESVLTPLVYAEALVLGIDVDEERTPMSAIGSNAACLKATLLNMSAELLLDEACVNCPPLLCSPMQRAMLKMIGEDRQASAYLNLAAMSLRRASKLTAEAALDTAADARRKDCLRVARAMIEQARGLSNETSLVEIAESLYARVRVASAHLPPKIEPFNGTAWPINALGEARNGRAEALDARRLLVLATTTERCQVEFVEQGDEPAHVNITLLPRDEAEHEAGAAK